MNWMDEPDFEVTDLRTGLPDERVYARADQQRRRRRLSVVVTALALLCALALPFISVPSFGATVRQALHLPTPTPAPTLALGADFVYFEHGLPWGSMLIDGKPITRVETEQPYTGLEALYTSFHLAPGRHQLEYRATLFPTLQCWISVPAAHSDTCPLVHDRSPQDVSPPYLAERVVNLGGDPAALSPAARTALVAAAASVIASLSDSATVIPGDSFADATGLPQVASASMTATLRYAIAQNADNAYTIPGTAHNCATLCDIQPASYVNDAQAQWVVAAHVSPAWTYTSRTGGAIAGSAAPQGVMPDSIVPLSVTWDGVWRVKIADSLATSPICFIALNLFASLHLSGAPLSNLKTLSAPMPADGCLALGDAVDATGAARIPFTVMYRFGLLFAVDTEARLLLPGMPVADARLRALASAWQG